MAGVLSFYAASASSLSAISTYNQHKLYASFTVDVVDDSKTPSYTTKTPTQVGEFFKFVTSRLKNLSEKAPYLEAFTRQALRLYQRIGSLDKNIVLDSHLRPAGKPLMFLL